jgi:hypothetical protein
MVGIHLWLVESADHIDTTMAKYSIKQYTITGVLWSSKLILLSNRNNTVQINEGFPCLILIKSVKGFMVYTEGIF